MKCKKPVGGYTVEMIFVLGSSSIDSLERLFWFDAADNLSVSADMKPFMTQKWNLSLIFLLSAFYLELATLFIWWF